MIVLMGSIGNNLNLIIGEDKIQQEFYLNSILRKIDYIDDNKITYDMSINKIDDIILEASTISLFATTKVIIGNNFDISDIKDNYDEIVKYVDNYNKDVYIILISNKIDARKKEYKLFQDKFNIIDISKSDNNEDVYNYVVNLIKENNYKMDIDNIKYFISKVGNDINNINNEINKLFIYKNDDKTIKRCDIDKLIMNNIDDIIYEFTNSIFDNDYNKMIKMYNDFEKENIGFDYLLSAISNSFRQALIVKYLYNNGKSNFEIAKVIGKKEFFVKKLLERLYMYTSNDISKYINKLCEIDYRFKSGSGNEKELLLFLINKDK